MRHFVHGSDGQKYGPADNATLQQWVNEGRLTPDTLLEPEVGGAPFAARDLPGLFPVAQQPQYYGQADWGYAKYPYEDPFRNAQAQKYATATWILGAAGVLCCIFMSFASIFTAVKAKELNHPQGQALLIYSICCTVVSCGFGIYSFLTNPLLNGAWNR